MTDNSKENLGPIATIIRKLQPRSIERIVLIGLVFLALILVYAVYNGSKISFLGIKIEASSHDNTKPGNTTEKKEDKIESPLHESKTSEEHISISDLSIISEKYFDPNLSKSQLMSRVKTLVQDGEELEALERNVYFKLLKLELLIPEYGRYIDTRLNLDDGNEVYQRIQSVLKDVGCYSGPINGDQQSTYIALVKFQMDYNKRAGKQILTPEDFGIFGYATLEAIRSTYRLAKN